MGQRNSAGGAAGVPSSPERARARVLAAALLATGLLAGSGAAADLLPHRALYTLGLAGSDPAVGLAEVEGGLVMEWQPACDGWISRQRLGFVATTEEGYSFSYDVRFSSWESRDGTRLRFQVRSFDDGRLFEEFQGDALLEAPGGPGVARFAVPEGTELRLPAGTLFPTNHMQRLIERALAGERFVSHSVFDGSGLEALSQVTAVIGAPRPAEPPPGLPREGKAPERWPVSMAYHPITATDDLPEFELSFSLDEQGVLDAVVLDYGDFALRATLDRIEPLPGDEGC
jgi:hypothetical protein